MHDPFLTPFIDEVLEGVGGQEMYSFTDGFFGYHHIRITKEDRRKTTFVTEWRCFQYIVMPFGLKNVSAIFSRVVVTAFKYFIMKCIKDHLANLRLMLERCRQHQIALNSKKCILCAPFGILLGHIVCKQGLLVDLEKIALFFILPPLKNVKML